MGNNQNNHKEHQPFINSEMYKISIVGYKDVGKTSIINKYLEGKDFNKTSYSITTFGFPLEGRNIGVEVCECLVYDDSIFSFKVHPESRRTDIFIFVYDISEKSTFISIKKIYHYIKIDLRKRML